MKTIAFHSFKGGVGRTSAALNFSRAMAMSGKKVILLELDVDAPGIILKPPISHARRDVMGYVDYLSHFYDNKTLYENVYNLPTPRDTRAFLDRIEFLDRISISVPIETGSGELRIIASGSDNDRYWWNLNSDWFNDFFSVARSEYSDTGVFHLHTNKNLFEEEKQLLERIFTDFDDVNVGIEIRERDVRDLITNDTSTTDYLVIDCKSAREYACVPLYYWCDAAVLMFPFNFEGVYNFVRMHRAVRAASTSVPRDNNGSVSILPVVCRTPADFHRKTDGSRESMSVEDMLSRLPDNLKTLIEDSLVSLPEDEKRDLLSAKVHSIQESSIATIDESLLLDVENADFKGHSRSTWWCPEVLEDQAELFSSILADLYEDKDVLSTNWLALLAPGDAGQNIRMDYVHQMDKEKTIFNKDQQPNVMLRRESMQLIMSRLSEAIEAVATAALESEKSNDDVAATNRALDSFGIAGTAVGISFVESSIRDSESRQQISFRRMVEESCTYDSDNAGFGQMSLTSNDDGLVENITWERCFFVEKSDEKWGWEIPATSISFLEGYLTGSLQAMYDVTADQSKKTKIKVVYDGAPLENASTKTTLKDRAPVKDNRLLFRVDY